MPGVQLKLRPRVKSKYSLMLKFRQSSQMTRICCSDFSVAVVSVARQNKDKVSCVM